MPEQRRTDDPQPGKQAPGYERDEVAVPIDTSFYSDPRPRPGDDAEAQAPAAAGDTATTSSSPTDVRRLEAEIAEADRLLSPQGEQEPNAPSERAAL